MRRDDYDENDEDPIVKAEQMKLKYNTENLNCETLYPGFYHLSIETGKAVVPIVANYNVEENIVLVAASNPIKFEGKSKAEAKIELRDTLATLRFNRIQYSNHFLK